MVTSEKPEPTERWVSSGHSTMSASESTERIACSGPSTVPVAAKAFEALGLRLLVSTHPALALALESPQPTLALALAPALFLNVLAETLSSDKPIPP